MNIFNLIALLPTTVKADTVDFTDVRMKTGKKGIRVTMDRLLTEDEKTEMKKCKKIIGVDCVTSYRYAPEIKKSYFYVV